MSSKRITGIIVLLMLCISFSGLAYDKLYQEQWTKRLDEVTQNFLLFNNVSSYSKRDKVNFPAFTQAEIDSFLKSKFENLYAGFHPDIVHYVNIISSRPQYQLQLWYAAIQQSKKQIRFENANKSIATLIFSRLEFPHLSFDNAWLLPNIISLNYGNSQNDYIDQRLQNHTNYLFRVAHYDDLIKRKNNPILALTMCVLGSATVTRINEYQEKSFWQLYPDLKSNDRDFYAVMLASSFVLNELEKLETENRGFRSLTFEDKHQFSEMKSQFVMHLEIVSKSLGIEKEVLNLINRVYYKQVVPSNMPFQLPSKYQTEFIQNEENLALSSAYDLNKIKAPFCLVKYKVKPSENINTIATNFSTSAQNILKINFISEEQIQNGRVLFIQVLQTDSVFYSSFNGLSAAEIIELKKTITENPPVNPNPTPNPTPTPNTQKVHVVKSGETLSHIARKYNVSVKQIKDWNKLKSDNIQIGQKLIIKK